MMSLETEGGSAEVSEGGSTESSSSSVESSGSKSGYSVTDPGYDAGFLEGESEAEGDNLEALIAANKASKVTEKTSSNALEEKPSEESDDASGDTDGDAEKQPVETADQNSISDELLDRAIELGYTLNEIRAFEDEKSLSKELVRVEKLQQRLQARQAGKPPAKDSEKPTETPAPESSDSETEEEPDWAEMIEAGHDPDVVNLQKKMWQRATKAEALVKQVFQSEQDRAWTAQCERFDDSLSQMEEYKDILGKGRRGELLKSSPEQAANRETVFKKMIVLKNGYQQMGVPVPSEPELIQEAVQASFWKQTKKIVRDELTREIKKVSSQALSRPHSSGNRPLTGQALATAKEAEFWKKHS